jgi:hypothetical protein
MENNIKILDNIEKVGKHPDCNLNDIINNPNNFSFIKNGNLLLIIKKNNIINFKNKKDIEIFEDEDSIKYIINHFLKLPSSKSDCSVLLNAIKENNDLIFADNLNNRDEESYYSNIKLYDSETCKPLSDTKQPKINKSFDYINFLELTKDEIDYFNKKDLYKKFHEFFKKIKNPNLEFVFKSNETNGTIEECLIDIVTNKELHPLLQINSNNITGEFLEEDQRIKAIERYLEFKKRKIYAVKENNSSIKIKYADGKDKGKYIPDHLQPIIIKKDKETCINILVSDYHHDDPRIKALNNLSCIKSIKNEEEVVKDRAEVIDGEVFINNNKVGRKLKDGSTIIKITAETKDSNNKKISEPAILQFLPDNSMKIYCKNKNFKGVFSDGKNKYPTVEPENKKLCEHCEKFVFQLFDNEEYNKICLLCLENLNKVLKNNRRKVKIKRKNKVTC